MSGSHRDYVPQNPAMFMEFCDRLIRYVEPRVTGNNPEWPNIQIERFEALVAKFEAFVESQRVAVEVPTKANHERRNEAQAEIVRELRAFVNQFLRFVPVTNADRTEMGIPNHDTIRTDHTVVTEIVDFVLKPGAEGQIIVDFWQRGSAHKAKPTGYDGAVIVWGILDAAPTSHDQLPHHIMASRTPFKLHFDELERGKTVWASLSWQNERGITGEWSPYKSAIVP